ncbi:MAG: hypothetical protein M0Z28_30380 [Rhodospirillales bacterium]|nr:hypothetical protein [Rhodospirillales bacterium]
MTVLNPDHLFEQAEYLAERRVRGRPREVDIRRAISTAYYGLFHFTLARMADLLVGASLRPTQIYQLAYRSVSHKTLRDLCNEALKARPSQRFSQFLPPGGFGPDVKAFSAGATELQERRHTADYDPTESLLSTDAQSAVTTARTARSHFMAAGSDEQRTFLCLLAFPPRGPA